MYPRTEMLDLVVINGQARGIVTRNLMTGEIASHAADAVVLGTGGYGNAFYLSTNAKGCNVTAIWRAHKRGAAFANPCFTQIHPTCIPVTGEHQSKLTLMSESCVMMGASGCLRRRGTRVRPTRSPMRIAIIFSNAHTRVTATWYRVTSAPVPPSGYVMKAGGRPRRSRVYLDFGDAIKRLGEHVIRERYGNLFEMYERITDENPYNVPMRIYPAIHYTMGGLWVDYNLMSTIPGLYVVGEANFSDHGANRLGASALMQGLADGYFILPYTIGDYLAQAKLRGGCQPCGLPGGRG